VVYLFDKKKVKEKKENLGRDSSRFWYIPGQTATQHQTEMNGEYLITKGTTLYKLTLSADSEFNLRCVKPAEGQEGSYAWNDSFIDPECDGKWAQADDGVLKLMGSAPKKFFYTFSEEGGVWKCTNNAGETMVKQQVPIIAAVKAAAVATDDDAFDPLDML
jgi:hypothetical protein